MKLSPQGRNVGIQWMRALAALLVVVDHGLYTLIDKAGADPASSALAAYLGGTGVKIFFVISGFVMIVSSTRAFGTGAAALFIRRRLTRIAPLYWLTTAVYAIKLWLAGEPATWPNLLRSLFFVPYLNAGGELQPVYGLGWTLNYETFFYLVFAVGLVGSLRATWLVTAAVLGSLVLFGLGMHAVPAGLGGQAVYFWSRPIMLFFVAGMALPFAAQWLQRAGHAPRLDFRTAALATLALVGAAVAIGLRVDSFPMLLVLVAGAVLVASMATVSASDRWFAPLATALGDASYSIYLTHSFAIGPLGRLYGKLGWNAPLPFLGVALVVCSCLGLLCYRWVEQPLLRWVTPTRRSGAAAVPA